jgi:NAD(P)-dependent dehydrogenase (short-subunit alcohol dehydrogenase family)
MGSLFGRFAVPFVGAYSGAKFALEAFADSLSMELAEWGIPVTILEPGNISTPIWKKVDAAVRSRSKDRAPAPRGGPPDGGPDLYHHSLEAFARVRERVSAWGIHPGHVARIVERALTARRPRSRYLVGFDARLLGRIVPALPARLRHLVVRWYTLRR